MYIKYAETKGWKVEVLDSLPCEAGGFSQISFMISGDSVYSLMKYESGSHRVQRVQQLNQLEGFILLLQPCL